MFVEPPFDPEGFAATKRHWKKEPAVELMEAIRRCEPGEVIRLDGEVLQTVLAAARRDLARQERERPPRPSLEVLERFVRDAVYAMPARDDPVVMNVLISAADVLNALRKKVVPWLRAVKMVHFSASIFMPTPDPEIVKLKTEDLLRALGEEP